MFIERKECVLCKSDNLTPFYSQKQFPLLFCATTQSIEKDIYVDLSFKKCYVCGCIQLASLIEPAILYSDSNKSPITFNWVSTNFTNKPIWLLHHTAFTDFIKEYNDSDTICEVGGGSNPLNEYFNNLQEYMILDLYDPSQKKPNVSYIIENCENFSSYKQKTVILSHTFEHLYNPRMFLKCAQDSSIENIFISVPNMNAWLEKNLSAYIVFSEHTFFYTKEDLVALFSMFGFECLASSNFQDHSLFFYFKKVSTLIPLQIPYKNNEVSMYNHFTSKSQLVSKINTKKEICIMPASYIGQIIHFFLKDTCKIIRFLDNDQNKVMKRLYGTDLIIHKPNSVLDLDESKTCVVIIKTPYYNEMYDQIKTFNSNIEVISIEV